MKKPRLITVSVEKIIRAAFNPEGRFHPTGMSALEKDIGPPGEGPGVIVPLLVLSANGKTGHYDLIDGERRLRAAIAAGHKMISVLVFEDLSQVDGYRSQFLARKPSGQDQTNIYLSGSPAAIPVLVRRKLAAAEELYGHDLMRAFADVGVSPSGFTSLIRANNWLKLRLEKWRKLDKRERQIMLAEWAIFTEQLEVMKRWIFFPGAQARRLFDAIMDGDRLDGGRHSPIVLANRKPRGKKSK